MEEYLMTDMSRSWKLLVKAEMPMWASYRPELDVSPELNHCDTSYYELLIGVLWWIVELGRLDICLEVSMLSSHLALPCEGHLEQVFQIFAYLKKFTTQSWCMTLVTLKLTPCSLNEGTGHQANFDILMEKKNSPPPPPPPPPKYARAMQDGVYHEDQG